VYFVQSEFWVFNQFYRDKKVVGVFVRFRAPLHRRYRVFCIPGKYIPLLRIDVQLVLVHLSFSFNLPM
jgi:hypothetical protein